MEKDDVWNLDAHDGEDEPEHEADEEHVDDRRDRVHQGVHHNLIVTVINALEMMIITLFMKVMTNSVKLMTNSMKVMTNSMKMMTIIVKMMTIAEREFCPGGLEGRGGIVRLR